MRSTDWLSIGCAMAPPMVPTPTKPAVCLVMSTMVRCQGYYGKVTPVLRGAVLGEIDELRAAVAAMDARLQLLEDQVEIMQLVAQYGPSVDSGSADATAALWTEDGSFDAVGVIEMHG